MKKPKLKPVSTPIFSYQQQINIYPCAEKAAFRAKMKGHYKGEFNMASLLRQKPPVDEDEEDDD